jgi:hypothetical protein
MNTLTNTRGVQNGIRQAFVYRGIQVMPTLDGGWLAAIGGRLYTECSEDDMCFAIDTTHVMIEAYQHRDAQPLSHPQGVVSLSKGASVAIPKQAISGGRSQSSPSPAARRYSTSKRGAA